MKFRILLLMNLFVFAIMQSAGQLKHYFTQNAIVHKNYFNNERTKSYFPLNFLLVPNFSYLVEQNSLGVELYFNDIIGAAYHMTSKDEVPFTRQYVSDGDLVNLDATNIGLAVHYRILDKPWLKISPMAGLIKNWYRSVFVEHWIFTNEPIFGRNKESRLGMLVGLNINIPVWKGIYCNANSRYTVFPGARYNKQNLIVDVGVGYMYQKKPKKQRPVTTMP